MSFTKEQNKIILKSLAQRLNMLEENNKKHHNSERANEIDKIKKIIMKMSSDL